MLYALYGTQWASPDISASFVPDGTPLDGGHSSALFAYLDARFSTDTWQREFARALQTWAQYTPLNFHFVSDDGSAQGAAGSVQGDSRFGDIRLSARATDSLGFAWSPNPTTRGGDLTVSTSYELHIGSMFDLYSLLLHESGHSLGMAHSADPDAIMLTSTTRVWNDLDADDIAGIRALYGARPHDAFDAAGGNDSFASATRLNSDGSGRIAVTADLTSLGDADYYSVTAPTGTDGTLSVSIDARGLSLLAPAVRVYDASGNLVASASAGDAYGTVASITVGGLIAGQKYFIVADGATTDPFGMGAYRLKAQFGGAMLPALAAPSNLVGRDVSSSQVALNWSDNSNSENGFKVLRSSNGGVTWNEVAVTAANATSYRDDAAAAGMAYQYRVLAFNTSTVSPPSNIASVLTAPAAPTGLAAW